MCQSVAEMEQGGVLLNFGSAISGPEVFLKALSLARNRGLSMKSIVAANFDIVPVTADAQVTDIDPDFYYRPRRNFIDRLQQIGGKGYLFRGLHQITIPHLFHRIIQLKQERGIDFPPYVRQVKPATQLKLFPVQERISLLHRKDLLKPAEPSKTNWKPELFDEFVERTVEARNHGKEVLISLGGNVIGSGVSLYLIDLIERGLLTHVAVNGACAFQDLELAAFGHTEESDESALAEGKLGMWKETGDLLHQALLEGYQDGLGYGDSLKRYSLRHPELFPYLDISLLGNCMRFNLPYTVHITIGTDAVQQHPDVDFKIQGGASGRDFQIYAHTVSELEGGVFMNFGSTVTGPEVFLKALSIARNLGFSVHHITTANFDIVRLGDYHRKAEIAALPPVDAEWGRISQGDRWKGWDLTAWLKADVIIPEEWAGKTVLGLFDIGKTGAGKVTVLEIDTDDLFFTASAAYQTVMILDENSWERQAILKALDRAFLLLNWRVPGDEAFYASVSEANNSLKQELAKLPKNNEVTVRCIGHTHIDVAWLWQLKHTREKAARSFSTVLRLMEKFPEYVFLQTQPQIYDDLSKDYPQIYEAIEERVKEGRWEAGGAMWLESDCNIPSEASAVEPQKAAELAITVSNGKASTPFHEIEWNAAGQLTRLYDKLRQRETIAEGETANRLDVHEDKPAYHEVWEIDIFYYEKPARRHSLYLALWENPDSAGYDPLHP
ncbi:unnamed protein product [Aphanomyces euteiches]